MKPLLIVDDSKTFLKTLEYVISQSGKFKPYTASSYSEAKILLQKNNFFAAIVDLNLPDCVEGKAVELTCSKNIPTIVLTGLLNKELTKRISNYGIVDYIIKSGESAIFSAAYAVESLLNFKDVNVLIIDDAKADRLLLKHYFENMTFKVTDTNNPLQALEILKNREQFKLIITDFHMSDMNGVELINEIKKMDLPDNPLIYGVTSSMDEQIRLMFLKSGAQDLLIKPIIKEEVFAKLTNTLKIVAQETKLKQYIKTIDKYVITSETDKFGNITYVSEAFCEISGFSKKELLGKNHNIVRHTDMPKEIYEDLWKTIQGGHSWSGEIKNRKKNGDFYWVKVNIEPVYNRTGDLSGYRAIRQDITDKKLVEELSITDPMTGLYNRRHFKLLFEKLLSIGNRENKPVGMILFDLDHFKQFNDTYGHQKGDDCLIAIGKLLKSICQRESDTPFRLGGEEFCTLSFNSNEEQLEAFGNLIRQELEALKIHHKLNTASNFVTASFGIATSKPGQQSEIEELYSKADAALYQAKEKGRNQVSKL